MAGGSHYRDDDDVELHPLVDREDEPDSPLPRHANADLLQARPRWLADPGVRWRTMGTRVRGMLQPRLTWKYLLSTVFVTYLFYCLARGSPLLASKLPPVTGEHDVGAVDIEVPVENPRNISKTVYKATSKPAFELETVLFTLYYPATKRANSKKRHYWIPKPISITAKGYAKAAHIDNFIMRPILTFALWAIAGSIQIPAKVDVPLLGSDDEDSDEKFPVIVFSHGTASSRTDYTQYCSELASRGIIVAAIEHRDGSGPGSVVTSKDGTHRNVFYMAEKELLSDPPMDTAKMKEEQLAFRQAEIEETVSVIQSLHAGKGADVFSANIRKEGHHLRDWENRVNLTQIVIGGHSYGATGALQALKNATSDQNPAVGGIIFDPGKSSGQLNTDINVPILVVHSTSWSSTISIFFGRPHFDTVRDLVKDVLKRVGSSWFMTSLGTSHPSVTDAPLIEPLLLRWTTGATINVNEGVREYVKVSLEFMHFLKNGTRTGILAEKVTHPAYGDDERSEERKKNMPQDIAKYWQIHVTPDR